MEESFSSPIDMLFPTLTGLTTIDAPDPFALSLQSGLMVCSAVSAAVQLKLPDALADDPQTVEQLASATGTHAPSLSLLLRALARIGIFAEVGSNPPTFVHTARSRELRGDSEHGMGDLVRLWSAPYQWDAWKNLVHTMRTGKPALEAVYGEGTSLWGYLHEHPQEAQTFQRGLTTNARLVMSAILASYDFSDIGYLVDVGGGQGQLSIALLEQYPQMEALLFDRPAVILQAQERIHALPRALAARYALLSGDFFTTVPPGGDCYVLKNVLMDWSDEEYRQILAHCRAAMHGKTSRLLVIEPVIGQDTPFTLFFSLQMAMMMHAARHRTIEEHRALFEQAGFRLTKMQPLGLEQMLLEGVPLALD